MLHFLTVLLASVVCISQATLDARYQSSLNSIYANILSNPKGTLVASPSKVLPDYFYMWSRDAALVTKALIRAKAPKFAFDDYATVSKGQQNAGGLGEPKFNVDGSVYTGPWGRPQNDGPALRVLSFAAHFEETGYSGDYYTIVKRDLEYISQEIASPCFDLWEEGNDHHFYTELVQYSALKAGIKIATRFNEASAASYYQSKMFAVDSSLQQFWNAQAGIIKSSLGGHALDVAQMLSCLHTKQFPHPIFTCSSDQIMSTVAQLYTGFKSEYDINAGSATPLFGRYPNDKYGGTGTGNGKGNPWLLASIGFADFCFSIGLELTNNDSVVVTQLSLEFYKTVIPGVLSGTGAISTTTKLFVVGNLSAVADAYLERVEELVAVGDHMSEQINRETGELMGARDLTWSYASFVDACNSRSELFSILG